MAALVVVAPAAVVGSDGSLVAATLGSSCAGAAGTNHVGLVVDFGDADAAGSARSTVRQCVTLADRGTGADALSAGGHVLGWSSSGLLCSIDGYPKPGAQECGQTTGHGYRYWSYWHGGSSWSYSSVGPLGFRPKDGSVEGWHFVDGGGNPSDPPPGASPASPCSSTPDSTTPTTTGGGSPSKPGTGDGGAAPTTTGPTGGSSGPTSTATDANGEVTSSSAPSGGAAADPAGTGESTNATDAGDEAALGPNAPASSRQGRSSAPIGVIFVVAIVAVLAGTAVVRFRSSPQR